MKRLSMLAAGFIFAAIFTVSASAQGAAAASPRLAVINTNAFSDQGGITRYINALTALENEFKPTQTELTNMATRLQTLQKEIETLQTQARAGTVPIDQAAAQKKLDDLDKLQREAKFKEESANAQLARRRQEMLAPITQDIGKALQEFSTQKGYDMIIDVARDEVGLVLYVNPAKTDVTKEFITFYNARPAGAATAATPRQ